MGANHTGRMASWNSRAADYKWYVDICLKWALFSRRKAVLADVIALRSRYSQPSE